MRKNMKYSLLSKIAGAAALVAFCGTASVASAQNTLVLSVDSAKTTITKALFGALMEQLGRGIDGGIWVGQNSTIPNTNGMRNDIIQAFKELNLGPFEWPGGGAASRYFWSNDTGKTNVFGTDQYMEWCRLCGIDPYICGNMGPDAGATATYMANWMRYINANPLHPEWYCKYLSLGNEPWGPWGDGNYTVTQFANKYDSFNLKLPSIPNKPLWRVGAGNYGDSSSVAWLDTMMRREKGKMEAINLHYYCQAGSISSTNFTDAQYLQIVTMAARVVDIIKTWDSVMLKYDPDRNVAIMFNEWGVWYAPISGGGTCYQQGPLLDAQVAAIHLNAFINNGERVTGACVAQAVNVIQALLLTNPSNQAQMVKTSTYYTFKLFKAHQNGKKIPATLTTPVYKQDQISFPLLSASGTVDSAGIVNITISNSNLTADQNLTITLNSRRAYEKVTGQYIWAPAATALNDFGKAEQVNIKPFTNANYSLAGSTLTVTVPAKAVVLLQLIPSTVGVLAPETAAFVPAKWSIKLVVDRLGTVRLRGVAGLEPGTLRIFNSSGRLITEAAFSSGNAIVPGLRAKGAVYWYTLKDRSGNTQFSGKSLYVN
jgi:alpha-N-arabinofuranosidase